MKNRNALQRENSVLMFSYSCPFYYQFIKIFMVEQSTCQLIFAVHLA